MKRFLILMFLLLCVPAFAQRKLTTNEATILAVGPFFDSTDGITPETGITVTGLTVEIYRELDDGSICTRFANFNPTASGSANDMALITSSISGMYSLEVTAAQLNFTGFMQITIVDTDSAGIVGLPFFRSFIITAANVVDAEYGTDRLKTDIYEVESSDATTYIDGRTLAAANYFLFGSDDVAKVTLVATTTASTDAETAIGNLNDFDPANDDVAVVTSVTTTTTNSDMITAATVEGECIDALESFKLDELNAEAVTTSLATAVHDNSILGYLFAKANVTNYSRSEDSGEGRTDYGDSHWITSTATSTVTTAQVEAEAIDALESFKLDEFMAEAVTTNLNTAVHDNSALGYLLASSDVALYVRTEDSLEDLRDRGDAAWDTATGFAVASDVTTAHSTTDALVNGIDDNAWDDGTRTLTALDEDSTTIDIDGSAVGSVTASVTTDAASRTASKADVSALATSAALSTHDGKLDTVDNLLDTEIADIIDKLKAIMSKAYSIVTAVGTFDPATDALEAQQENPQAPPIID